MNTPITAFCLVGFVFVVWGRVLLCNSGWPGTYFVDWTDLEIKRSAHPCLLWAGFKGLCHYARIHCPFYSLGSRGIENRSTLPRITSPCLEAPCSAEGLVLQPWGTKWETRSRHEHSTGVSATAQEHFSLSPSDLVFLPEVQCGPAGVAKVSLSAWALALGKHLAV